MAFIVIFCACLDVWLTLWLVFSLHCALFLGSPAATARAVPAGLHRRRGDDYKSVLYAPTAGVWHEAREG